MITNRVQAAWVVRLLLAALFLFGGEVLLWTGISHYTLVDWLLRLVGYTALATMVLDIAVRYRIRDVYDVMVVCAMYGLLASLLITPTVSFAKFPDSILTRVLGGHTLLGFEMWGFFLVLTAGHNRRYRLRMLGVALWLGFFWGIWMRWTPEFGTLFEAVSLPTMFMVAAGFCMAALLINAVVTRISLSTEPLDMRLSRLQWIGLVVVLFALFGYQFFVVRISVWAVVVVALLLVVCWGVIWFRREAEGKMLLDDHFPMKPLSLLWIMLAAALFTGATLFSYHLPLVGTRAINQLWLMELGFGAVGTLWLPLVAAVLAIRGIDYQMRTNQLT